MRALTVSRVLSSDRCMTSATTLLNTAPTAAPVTVPNAPKNDPHTALMAAAPAPAMTLVAVRSFFGGSATAVVGPVSDAPLGNPPVVPPGAVGRVGGGAPCPGPYPPFGPGPYP